MTPSYPQEDLALAAAAVQRACSLLTNPTPQALDGCLRELERGVALLRPLADGPAETYQAARPRLLEAFRRLRAALRQCSALLSQAAGFHAGWLRILQSLTAGYTADGQPAEAPPSHRYALEA